MIIGEAFTALARAAQRPFLPINPLTCANDRPRGIGQGWNRLAHPLSIPSWIKPGYSPHDVGAIIASGGADATQPTKKESANEGKGIRHSHDDCQ
jgi:hypothetical protein